jgi:proteasome lid subunit RPN8/RPN11
MAKAKKTKKQDAAAPAPPESGLPQNIRLIGEADVESGKVVYILQSVYKAIHRFAEGKTSVESGGILAGQFVEQFGKTHILINGFIEAKHCEATACTLKFTHETWEHCHKEMAGRYADQKIVGWIHTHPDFGIFLSEYDTFIQSNFFNGENQVAYVIDPVQNLEGVYVRHDEHIARCNGFFIFDKTGAAITVAAEHEESAKAGGLFSRAGLFHSIALAALFAAVLMLLWRSIGLDARIDALQARQQEILNLTGQELLYFRQQIALQQEEIKSLRSAADAQGRDAAPADTDGNSPGAAADGNAEGGNTDANRN